MWLWRSRILEYLRRRQYVAHTWNIRIENTGIRSAHNHSWIDHYGLYYFIHETTQNWWQEIAKEEATKRLSSLSACYNCTRHSTFHYLFKRVRQCNHARAKVKFETFKSRMTRVVLTAYLPAEECIRQLKSMYAANNSWQNISTITGQREDLKVKSP